MNKKILIGSIIATIILIGVSFTSVVGFHSVNFEIKDEENKEINNKKDLEESKEILFEIIIEIAENPEIKKLFKDNKQNLFSSNYDYREVFFQLLKQKFTFPFEMIFHKPSLSYDYLDFIFNHGCEIIDILGKETVLKLIASVKITDEEIFEELNNIVINNDELSDSIVNLIRMNEKIISIKNLTDTPILCVILAVVFITIVVFIYTPVNFIIEIFNITPDMPIAKLILLILSPIDFIFLTTLYLFFFIFDCFPSPYYPSVCSDSYGDLT